MMSELMERLKNLALIRNCWAKVLLEFIREDAEVADKTREYWRHQRCEAEQ